MDVLREGIGLRAYGQRDPLIEYKIEAYRMYEGLITEIEDETVGMLFKAELVSPETRESFIPEQQFSYTDPEQALLGRNSLQPRAAVQPAATGEVQTITREHEKIGRNDPCPCGSGKKYKKCCGK
jgi:preprotein translocase subunit SecA